MNALMEAIDGIGYALDTPGAYLRGALSGRFGERASGQEMLSSWGMEDPGAGAGFAAELVSDPLAIAMPLLGALGIKRMLPTAPAEITEVTQWAPGSRIKTSLRDRDAMRMLSGTLENGEYVKIPAPWFDPYSVPMAEKIKKTYPMAEGPFTLAGASPSVSDLHASGLRPLERTDPIPPSQPGRRGFRPLFDPQRDDELRKITGGIQFRGPDGKLVEVSKLGVMPYDASKAMHEQGMAMLPDLAPTIESPLADNLFVGKTHTGEDTILRAILEYTPDPPRYQQIGVEDGIGRYGRVTSHAGDAVNAYAPTVDENGDMVWMLAGSKPASPSPTAQVPFRHPGPPDKLTAAELELLDRLKNPDKYVADWRPTEMMPEDYYAGVGAAIPLLALLGMRNREGA